MLSYPSSAAAARLSRHPPQSRVLTFPLACLSLPAALPACPVSVDILLRKGLPRNERVRDLVRGIEQALYFKTSKSLVGSVLAVLDAGW